MNMPISILPFLMKYWMRALLAVSVPVMIYLVYDRIRESAIQETNQAWTSQLKEVEKRLANKVDEVRDSSQKVSSEVRTSIARQTSAINLALSSVSKGKPGDFLVVNNEGKCELRKDYTDTFLTIRNQLP